MEYDDSKIPTLDDYALMAKAYSQSLKKRGFFFMQITDEEIQNLLNDTFTTFAKLKSCLFFLAGFLGTGSLYTLGEKQIRFLQALFEYDYILPSYKIRGDKTKCFLCLISLENKLSMQLLQLAKISAYPDQLEQMLNERMEICAQIFDVKGVVLP